jgi:hypothetical protein
LPLPLSAPELRKTPAAVVADIDRMIDEHTDLEIAEILNARGLRPRVADRFSNTIIYQLRKKYRLGDRFDRLRRQGLLTVEEATTAYELNPSTLEVHALQGRLLSFVYNDKASGCTPHQVNHR